jgi:hypothetical protein
MNIIVKSALGLIAAGVLLTLALASQKPDTFEVSRSRVMSASPERLFPLINDLHQFNVWSPYNAKDPKIEIVYSGASTGPGSRYTFEGNQNVGKGALGITASTAPSQVTMQLDMLEPMEGHNTVVFSLQPEGHLGHAWPRALHQQAHRPGLQHGPDDRPGFRSRPDPAAAAGRKSLSP